MLNKFSLSFLACCLALTTLAYAEDPDYGNTAATAFEIELDTVIHGSLTVGDEDWLTFTPQAKTKYRFTYFNASSNYKYFSVFQDLGFDALTSAHNASQYANSGSYDMFFEYALPIYIKISGGIGAYNVTVTALGSYPDDSYGKTPATATEIIADAPATIGTLTVEDSGQYHDWFLLQTQPLHKYRISRSQTLNSSITFQLYNADGSVPVHGGTTDMTVTSLYGEDYLIKVFGPENRTGQYYELQVELLASYIDAVGNTPAEAMTVSPGNVYSSSIDYQSTINSDEDWFVFTPTANTRYEITFSNPDTHYKYIYLFQDRGLTNLTSLTSHSSYANAVSRKIFINTTEPVYIKISGGLGNYSFQIDIIEVFPPDNHPQDKDTPKLINVDSVTPGSISPDQSIGEDWFVFNTVALHKYHLTLYNDDNCNVHFQLFDMDNNAISGGTRNMTFVSWFGQQYKIKVYGDRFLSGNYYELSVADIETHIDDYPNIISLATPIEKDGTLYTGMIDYSATIFSDEDWFRFVAPVDGNYVFYLANYESNYKYFRIYYYDHLDRLIQAGSFNRYNNSGDSTLNLTARTYYIKVEGGLGKYDLSVTSPEPRCGDLEHPYPAADINKDCLVDLQDFAILASQWLMDTRPVN